MKQPIKLGRLFSMRTLKVILSWLVLAAIIAGLVFLAVNLVEYVESDTKTIKPRWSLGDLDDEGSYIDSKASLYTTNAFECAGLDIKVNFDADITYDVIFYDGDGELLTTVDESDEEISAALLGLTGHFTSTSIPEDAVYCRVVIHPENDSNITFFERAKYSRMITIEVAK